MICGIYKITNKVTGEIYIGQSIDIFSRWKTHSVIQDDTKFHLALQEKIEDFTFEILEQCQPENLNIREKYWINKYNSYNEGYNMTEGGYSFPDIENSKKKQVNQYHLDGTYITSFASLREAINATGISQIGPCCRLERKTAGGFQWRYEEDFPANSSLPECNKPSSTKRPVIQYDLAGNKIKTYPSAAEAGRSNNVSSSCITLACQHKTSTTIKNSYWGYADEIFDISKIKIPTSGRKKPVSQLNKDGEVLHVYESASAAARALGRKNSSSISDACRGKIKTAYGYKWKYID